MILYGILSKSKNLYRSFLMHNIVLILTFTFLYYIASYLAHRYKFKDITTDKHMKRRYTLYESFYFTLTTQATVGYGELRPTNTLTQIVNIFQLICILATISYHM